ncbi:MAG: ferredoxin family protein [Actinomycetota bacterium]|nr:ferredoxin family protein [Actinomycetota bacterium]
MPLRKIIKIDEEKCDGCGQCVVACAKGTIEIVDGKARLIRESYCDGLGSCVGECPQGAITVEEREAEEFDERAAGEFKQKELKGESKPREFSCQSQAPLSIERCEILDLERKQGEKAAAQSMLSNWPVQIQLVPPTAPYLKEARLVIAADCTAFSFASFHERFLSGRILLIGCPKLDNFEFYRKKLTEIFRQNKPSSILVVYMEVPCCFGFVHLVHLSMKESNIEGVPLELTKIGINGDILETKLAGKPEG